MKKFELIKVTCNDDHEVRFAINHSKVTDKDWHEMNDFWGGAKYRLNDAGDDIVKAVLCMLASHCLQLQVSNDLNTYGVMNAFDWDDREGQEGWPKMDGSHGILITSVDTVEFESYLFNRENITKMPEPPSGNL